MRSSRWKRTISALTIPVNRMLGVKPGRSSLVYQVERTLGKIRKHTRDSQRLIFGKIDDGIFISPTKKPINIKSLEAINQEIRVVKAEEARIRESLEMLSDNMEREQLLRELTGLRGEADKCYITMKGLVVKLDALR